MESYSLTNIKSFKNYTEVNIKPITIFVGKNSCGKSSLMRFPVVLSQTAEAVTATPLKFYGKQIDYGHYDDVVFNHSSDPIEFSIKYRLDIYPDKFQGGKLEEQKSDIRDVEVKVALDRNNKKVEILKNEIIIDGILCYGLYKEAVGEYRTKIFQVYDEKGTSFSKEEFDILIRNCSPLQFFVRISDGGISSGIKEEYFPEGLSEIENGIKTPHGDEISIELLFRMSTDMRNRILNQFGVSFSDNEIIKKYMFILSSYRFYSELLGEIHAIYEQESSCLAYIGPFRRNPERIYRDEEFLTKKVGVQGENVTTVLYRDYQKKAELISCISSWLERTMGYKLIVDEVSNGLFSLILEDVNGIKSNLMDVGYGISQILPIIAQILVEPSKKKYSWEYDVDNLVIIEQPELHLHPAAQSELADLFVDSALVGKKKILIETHSEHLIRKLQVLVADSKCKLTNEDVAVYYVDKDTDGIAIVKELKILANGKFAEKWPSGFFDKAHELSMELLRVAYN